MNTHRTTRRAGTLVWAAVFLPLMALAASQVVAAAPVTDYTVAERVATAETAADHEAIAAYYHAGAARSRAAADQHEATLAKYRGLSSETTRIMVPQYKMLVSEYQKAAELYDRLAMQHEDLAKNAEQTSGTIGQLKKYEGALELNR